LIRSLAAVITAVRALDVALMFLARNPIVALVSILAAVNVAFMSYAAVSAIAEASTRGFANELERAAAAQERLSAELRVLDRATREQRGLIEETTDQIKEWNRELRRVDPASDRYVVLASLIEAATERLAVFTGHLQGLEKERAVKEQEQQATALDRAYQELFSTLIAIDKKTASLGGENIALRDKIQLVNEKLAAQRRLFDELARSALPGAESHMKSVGERIRELEEELRNLGEEQRKNIETQSKFSQSLGDVEEKLRETSSTLKGIEFSVALGVTTPAEGIQAQYETLRNQIESATLAMAAQKVSFEEIGLATEAYRARLALLREEVLLSQNVWVVWGEQMRQMFESSQAIVNQFSEMTFRAFQNLATGIGQTLARALVFGEDIEASFVRLVKNIAAQFIAALISMAIQSLIFAIIGRALGLKQLASTATLKAGETFAAAYASVMSALPFPANIVAAPIVASAEAAAVLLGSASFAVGGALLAEGGIVMSPIVAQIGEAGPEAVIPLNRFDGFGAGDTTVILEMDGYEWARVMTAHVPGIIRRKIGI